MTAHFRLWYALPLLLQVVIAGCGGGSSPGSASSTPPGAPPSDPAPAPGADCGIGLAATDLAGTCRARPNPTMGALEAIARGPDRESDGTA